MAVTSSGFFDARKVGDTWDRVYLADSFASYFASFIGNGVFVGTDATALQVVANDPTDLYVKVTPGRAWINGYWFELHQPYGPWAFEPDPLEDYWVTVYVKRDMGERTISLITMTGDPGDNTPPSETYLPKEEDGDYVLALANIKVKAAATSIKQEDITDLRSNNNYCGFVHGVVDQVSTTALYAQFEDYFNNFKTNSTAAWDEWVAEQEQGIEEWEEGIKSDTEAWIQHLKDILDEETAIHLQLEIEALQAQATKVVADLSTLLHAKENVEQWTTITLAVNGWTADPLDNTRYIYSLESLYPVATYDITNVIPSTSTTADQRKAWSAADCGGYDERNVIVCHGTVPTVAIPLSICIRKKVANPNYSPTYQIAQ